MNQVIKNRIDFIFPSVIIVFTIIFLIFGLLFLINYPIPCTILIFVCSIILSMNYGTEINVTVNAFRKYYSILGLKFGKWQSIKEYKSIYVSKKIEEQKFYIRGVGNARHTSKFYWIVLLSTETKKTIKIRRFKSKILAVDFASKLSKSLKIEY